MPTAAELLFRIQTQGVSDLDKINTTIRTVGEGTRLTGAALKTFDASLQSAVANGKTFQQALQEIATSQGVLSGAVRSTASELLLQIRAADGDADAIRRLSSATHGLADANTHAVSQISATSGAIRVLEGNMPIRAVENLLAKTLGLGPAFQAAFPIFGAVALGEVVVHVAEKVYKLYEAWDPVISAENRAKKELEDYSAVVDRLKEKFSGLNIAGLTAAIGQSGGSAYAANQLTSAAAEKDRLADIAQRERAHAEAILTSKTENARRMLDPKYQGDAVRDPEVRQAQADVNALTARVSALRAEAEVLRQQASSKIGDSAQAQLDENAKKAKADARGERPFDQARKQVDELLERAQLSELTGLEKINAERQNELDKLKQYPTLVADINKAFDIQVAHAQQQTIEKATHQAHLALQRDAAGEGSNESRALKLDDRQFAQGLKQSITQDERTVKRNNQMLDIYDQADADATRRQFSKASTIGGLTGESPEATYQRRIDLAKQLNDIELRRVDRIENADDKAYAIAKAKYDLTKSEDDAAIDRETELLKLQKQRQDQAKQAADQQAERDKTLASELANIALSPNSSRGFHDFAVQQGRQLLSGVAGNAFGGVAGGILNTASGVIPPQLKSLFEGTILDRKGNVQDKIEDHTLRTAKAVEKIAGLSPGGGGSSSATGPSGLLGAFASDLDGFTGGGFSKALSLGKAISALSTTSGNGGGFSDSGSTTYGGGSEDDEGRQLDAIAQGGKSSGNRAGKTIASVAEIAGGAVAAYQGFKQGGAGGALKGTAGVLETAAGVASLIPGGQLIGGVLAAVGGVTGLLGGILGNNPAKRANDIANELGQNQYNAPQAWNVTQSTNGTFGDFDARGNYRQSNFSAIPTVSEPYETTAVINGQRQYYQVPGQVTQPFGAPVNPSGGAAPMIVQIQAMDAQSFHDYAQNNAAAFGAAVTTHVRSAGGELASALGFHFGR